MSTLRGGANYIWPSSYDKLSDWRSGAAAPLCSPAKRTCSYARSVIPPHNLAVLVLRHAVTENSKTISKS